MVQAEAPRLGEDVLAFLRGVDSATVANAIEEFGLRDLCEGFVGGAVRCLTPELGPVVGYAVTATMTSEPGPPGDGARRWDLFAAVERSPRPAMIVIQDVSGRPTRAALWGDVTATIGRRLGAVGLVTDGGVRDLDGVRALGFALFAPHVVVSHANAVVVDVGGPVELDGQTVRTGDLLHGDANGVVLIPAETLTELPAAVERVRERERRLMDYARSEAFAIEHARAGTYPYP